MRQSGADPAPGGLVEFGSEFDDAAGVPLSATGLSAGIGA